MRTAPLNHNVMRGVTNRAGVLRFLRSLDSLLNLLKEDKMNQLEVSVITKDRDKLFSLNFVPQVGSELHYSVDWGLINYHQKENKGTDQIFSAERVLFWKKLDGKTFIVDKVIADVRNFFGVDKTYILVEVSEKTES